MSIAHILASGMGGIRTSGDLVARMEFSKNMKVGEAKKYVAKKLELSEADIADETVMREVRENLGLGVTSSVPKCARGIETKFNIERVLGIEINSCDRFRELSHI